MLEREGVTWEPEPSEAAGRKGGHPYIDLPGWGQIAPISGVRYYVFPPPEEWGVASSDEDEEADTPA